MMRRLPGLSIAFHHVAKRLSGATVEHLARTDRLARSTRDLLEISDTIAQAGAGLESLSEPCADTTSPAGRMVLTVFAGLTEYAEPAVMRSDAIEVEVWSAIWPLGAPHNIKCHGRQRSGIAGRSGSKDWAVRPEPGRNLFGGALTFPG